MPPEVVGSVMAASQLGDPHEWYPAARAARRRVVLHLGPTNSGKTHAALAALRAARQGTYCGPLRLLAWEIFERLNDTGTACNLVTGQELDVVPGAAHMACTVEMADVHRPDDVVVLDEIQMIGDASRGWAWTRVLLGTRAREVHCCGDGAAEALVRALLAATGDELVVHNYARLSPLAVAGAPVASLSHVARGDCVVAFSRAELFGTKRAIEVATGLRCGIIYGALPPAVRREQARRFNLTSAAAGDGGGGGGADAGERTDVMVATDAIGMGLNLAIRRVVFSKLDKFDGERRRDLNISEIKQIGGRAGRFGSQFAAGEVSSLRAAHLPRLASALAATTPPIRRAGLLPSLEQLELFAAALLGRVSLTAADTDDTDDDDDGDDFDSDEGAAAASSSDTVVAADDDALRSVLEDAAGGYEAVAPTSSSSTRTTQAPVSVEVGSVVRQHRARQGGDDSSFDAMAAYDWRERSTNAAAVRQAANAALTIFPFSRLLAAFVDRATLTDNENYFLCNTEDMVATARLLDDIPGLTFHHRYMFCMCPVDLDEPLCTRALQKYARTFAARGKVKPGLHVPPTAPTTPQQLRELEAAHAVLDMYLWLGRRFPLAFSALAAAQLDALRTQELIQEGLEAMGDAARAIAEANRLRARRRAAKPRAAAADAVDAAHLNNQSLPAHLLRRLRRRAAAAAAAAGGADGDAGDDGTNAAARPSSYWQSMVGGGEVEEWDGFSESAGAGAVTPQWASRSAKRAARRQARDLSAAIAEAMVRGRVHA